MPTIIDQDMAGGCQCGAVRFTAHVADDDAYFCHCRMCQRASGNVFIAFKGFARADIRWDGEPDWHASSNFARRAFCARCGTPLAFAYVDSPKMDLLVGTFGDPTPFRPTSHFGAEAMIDAWVNPGELPMMRCEDYAPLVARWEQAGQPQTDEGKGA